MSSDPTDEAHPSPPGSGAESSSPLAGLVDQVRASALRQWPQLVVIAGVAVGLLVVASHHFRRGTFLIGACLLLHAGLRAVLPRRRAGWLALRSRVVDVATSTAFGLALVLLTVVVPPPT